jgi:hypothetical protein
VKLCEAAVRRLYSELLPAADLWESGGKVNLQIVGPSANIVTQGKCDYAVWCQIKVQIFQRYIWSIWLPL